MHVHRNLVVVSHDYCYWKYAAITLLSSIELIMLLSRV
jgi:hypothetical protein